MTEYGILQNSRGVSLIQKDEGQSIGTNHAIEWFADRDEAVKRVREIDPDWSDPDDELLAPSDT